MRHTVIALVALATVACSSSQQEASPDPSSDDTALVSQYLGVRDDALRAAITHAEVCLELEPSDTIGLLPADADIRVPGVLMPTDAVREGYEGLDAHIESTVDFFDAVYVDTASTGGAAGSPEGQGVAEFAGTTATVDFGPCTARAIAEQFGSLDVGTWHLLALDYLFSATDEEALAADTEVLFEPWAKCMATLGSPYSTPRDAWLAATTTGSTGTDIAVADATCREEVGLNEVLRTRVLTDAGSLLRRDEDARAFIVRLLETGPGGVGLESQ